MTFNYEVDAEGLATFLVQARQYADDLQAASPSGDGSLGTLTDEGAAVSDPDIAGLLSGIFTNHESDLVRAVTSVSGAIDSVEQASSAVYDADGSSNSTFTTLSTGSFDPSRFSAH